MNHKQKSHLVPLMMVLTVLLFSGLAVYVFTLDAFSNTSVSHSVDNFGTQVQTKITSWVNQALQLYARWFGQDKVTDNDIEMIFDKEVTQTGNEQTIEKTEEVLAPVETDTVAVTAKPEATIDTTIEPVKVEPSQVETIASPVVTQSDDGVVYPFSGEKKRMVLKKHEVKPGKTVSGVAYDEWGNAYLWPDLYVHNVWRTADPDLIYPGEVVNIINRLGNNGQFSTEDLQVIEQSYLKVYHLYRNLGDKRQASRWYALNSALKFNSQFLEKYKSQIDPKDAIMAVKYKNESSALS
jgi:hypothetical protein